MHVVSWHYTAGSTIVTGGASLKGFLLLLVLSALMSTLALTACASDEGDTDGAMTPRVTDDLKAAVVDNYASGTYTSYVRSLNSAITMDGAIDSFLAAPSLVRLDAAKRAWLYARDDYGVTEIYRFYNGPIDNEEDGPEGSQSMLGP